MKKKYTCSYCLHYFGKAIDGEMCEINLRAGINNGFIKKRCKSFTLDSKRVAKSLLVDAYINT